MNIKQILKELDNLLHSSKEQLVIVGVSREFCSYRGYYSELCVAPSFGREMSLCEFYNVLSDQIGQTYEGYKGGQFTMSEETDLYIANYGDTGERITGISVDGNKLSFVTRMETW